MSLRHSVGHDGEGGDSQIVEVDDVVEAFGEDMAVFGEDRVEDAGAAGFITATSRRSISSMLWSSRTRSFGGIDGRRVCWWRSFREWTMAS